VNARALARALPFALAACGSVYRPATVALPAAPAGDAFDRVLAVVRERYPRLVLADRDGFRLQSDWLPFARGDVPGERRATVYREHDRLAAVVEVRYLVPGLLAPPAWTSVGGDRRLEDDLVQALDAALR
jgi:hypothetical protein